MSRGGFALAALGLFGAGAASAFIPPGSFILGKLAGKLAPLRGVTATLQGTLYAGDDASGIGASGRLYLAPPDRFRLETVSAEATSVEVWAGGSRTVRARGRVRSEPAGPHPLTALFLGGNPRAALRARGVDTRHVTLGRFQGYICWVVGAKAEDPTRPQLWVDKETFLPVRLILFEGEGDARRAVEWWLLDYDPVNEAAPFPRALELRVGGQRVLRMAVQSLDVRALPRDSLFHLPGER